MSDTKTKQVGGEDTPVPVADYFLGDANVLIEGNRLVWSRKDTGYAQNSTYALANPLNVICWGTCQEHFDNTTANAAAFNNSGLTGAKGRYNRGVFLCQGDGTFTLQSALGQPVYLVSDVTGTNNGLVTVSTSSASGTRPYVGYVSTNPRGSTDNPDASKIPIIIGMQGNPAGDPGMLQQAFTDDSTLHTAAFTVYPGVMHSFNFQSTANINFPAITAAIDGFAVALCNQGTGATASTLVGSGTTNIGIKGVGTTGATAAGPTSLAAQRYTANLTLGAWVPGI